MKKLGFIFLALCSQGYAATSGVNTGAGMTMGPSSNHFSIFSASHNAAMAPLMIDEDEKFRVNYFPSLAFNLEIGDVSNFADDLDELIDLIDDSSGIDDLDGTINRFNDVLIKMGETGYLKNTYSIHAPILPAYMRLESIGATIFADVSMDIQASLQVLDAPIELVGTRLETSTSIYFKSGIEKRLSLGYGRDISNLLPPLGENRSLFIGAKLNFISLELSKQVSRLQDLDGEDVADYIEDQYDKNLKSTSGVGLDIGAVYDTKKYRIGAVLENINSPSFEYGTIGVNCEDIDTANENEVNSCNASRFFIGEGEITDSEKHTKHALLRVDGLAKISDRWFVSSSLDMAKYDDIVGFENQWFHLSTSYETKGYLVPAVRLGYQTNLAGSKLSSMNFGFTFFKALSLDIEYGLETVEADGESAPQRLGLSLGFEEKF